MTAGFEDRDQSNLQSIVAQLKDEGWSVSPQPPSSQVPEQLRGLHFDFIATRGNETLIGEIATRSSARAEKIDLMARRIAQIPNARFEVFWRGEVLEPAPPQRDVMNVLEESLRVAELSPKAGLLLAWSAFEGAVMRLATQRGASVDAGPRGTQWQVFVQLYSLGEIDSYDFERLSVLRRRRSEIAHSPVEVPVSREDVDYLVGVTRRLASGKYESVDREADTLVEWFFGEYEDPAEGVPFASAEGGYQYVLGGPFDAASVIRSHYPNAPEVVIEQAVHVIEQSGAEWVRKGVY